MGTSQSTVTDALARLLAPDFVRFKTMWASDHRMAMRMLDETEPVQALRGCGEAVCAELEARARSLLDATPDQGAQLIAIVQVLRNNRYTKAVPVLAEYVRRFPPDRVTYMLDVRDPLPYVVDALVDLTDGAVSIPDDADLIGSRAQIADSADGWCRRRHPLPGRRCPTCQNVVPAGKAFCTRDGTRVP